MDDAATDPHDDKVRTVALPTNVGDGADRVITQENQSREVALGGGEWPSPDTPPSDAAPGGPPPRIVTGGRPAGAAGDEEENDGEGEFPNMREVLDANPVAGGSQSVAADDEDDGSDGGRDDRWGASRLP